MFRPNVAVTEAVPERVAVVVEMPAADEGQEVRAVDDLGVWVGVAHPVARERLVEVLVSLHLERMKRAGEMRTPGSRIHLTKSVPPGRNPEQIPIEMQIPGPIPIAMI